MARNIFGGRPTDHPGVHEVTHSRLRQTGAVTHEQRTEVFEQLRRVIAWEIDAQIGVERPVEQIPALVADTVLDFFDVRLKPGADLANL